MKRINIKHNHIIKGSKDYLGDYLKTLGIKEEDLPSFIIRPRDNDKDDPLDLNNIERAVKTAYGLLIQGTPTYIQPDPDTDGFTSAAVLYQYLNRRFPNVPISWRLHSGKDHGIEPDFIPAEDKLVFIPDAGSNDIRQQTQLIAEGKTVIILDHHEVEIAPHPEVILVNNQISPHFSNKYMSGVGIVYMFITLMDELYFNDNIADDFLDLTAVGIIADAMNMTSLGNNYIAYYGLQNIRNNFLKELIGKESRGIKDANWLSKIDVAFYIAPVINGVIRSGTAEDKELVFKAMIDNTSSEIFESTWRGVKRAENLWQYAVRHAINAKSRQDDAKKKGFEQIKSLIIDNGWDKHNLIIAPLENKIAQNINPNFTGLIAMELVKEFNKPCLVLRETDYNGSHVYAGSGRNGSFFGLPSLLDFVVKSGLTTYAAGHANAFGVHIKPEDIALLRQYSDEKLNAKVFTDDIIDVDFWFTAADVIDTHMLEAFASAEKLYGNSIPQPKFAFTISDYGEQDYRVMGKNQDSIKIHKDGVDFVVFKDPLLVHKIGACRGGDIIMVGRPQINEWMGRTNIQIMVDDIDVIEKAPTTISKEELDNSVQTISWNDLI